MYIKNADFPASHISSRGGIPFLPESWFSGKWVPLKEKKLNTLQGTNISPKNGILKMIFLFPRWDMLIPWRVILEYPHPFSTEP